MNRFEQAYLNIINEWNSNLLLETNLKSLIPLIQDDYFQTAGIKSYNDLNDYDKQVVQDYIDQVLKYIENKVNEITDNKQYQSWIYNILKNKEVKFDGDMKQIINAILEFTRLCKRPDLKPNQRNIENYKSLNALLQFIDSFKEEHKLQNNIYKNLKKVYNNDEFTVYFINSDQYDECNKLFGGNQYFNTGWCIAKNEEHFDGYINDDSDQYDGYFVFIKDNKPYALLHYGSNQFKDTSDQTLITNNPNIIDCLIHINDDSDSYKYDDLAYYYKHLFLKENPNKTVEDWIAYQIDGEYDPKTKTIDCNGHRVKFKKEWLDENGTFDFTFINTSDDWSYMFSDCAEYLIKLPDTFVIPTNVIDCYCMFDKCINLKELPENFTIPNTVKNCNYMFYKCINLKKLPEDFTIPKNNNYNNIFKESGLDGKYKIKDLLR